MRNHDDSKLGPGYVARVALHHGEVTFRPALS